MYVIRDEGEPFPVWIFVVFGRRMRMLQLSEGRQTLGQLPDCRYRQAQPQFADVWGAGCLSAWRWPLI